MTELSFLLWRVVRTRGWSQGGVVNVLLIEDDPKISSFVRKGLEAQEFTVDVFRDGDQGCTAALDRPYDVILLDIMVPGQDGLSILKLVRERRIRTPVMLITARGSLQERVEGLNLGADDYLAKPFYMDELVARIRALLRRASGERSSLLRAGDLTVNLLTREVLRGAQSVELSAREYALLTCLMSAPGRVFTRSQLQERVWNYHHDPGTNLVDVYVQRVRRKIADSFDSPLIETLRGVGYRFRSS
jgi:two-component system OmpR family response regulator